MASTSEEDLLESLRFDLRRDIDQQRCLIYDSRGKKFCTRPDDWNPELWQVLAEPCLYESRWNAAWEQQVPYCVSCEKQAGSDHLMSGGHRRKVAFYREQLRNDYLQAISTNRIPPPTDGLNWRDCCGSIVPPDDPRGTYLLAFCFSSREQSLY